MRRTQTVHLRNNQLHSAVAARRVESLGDPTVVRDITKGLPLPGHMSIRSGSKARNRIPRGVGRGIAQSFAVRRRTCTSYRRVLVVQTWQSRATLLPHDHVPRNAGCIPWIQHSDAANMAPDWGMLESGCRPTLARGVEDETGALAGNHSPNPNLIMLVCRSGSAGLGMNSDSASDRL